MTRRKYGYVWKIGLALAITMFVAGVAIERNIAKAEFFDGARLLRLLKQPGGTMERATGVGYVMGAADVLMGTDTCPPKELKAGQLADVVAQFIEAQPEHSLRPADIFVTHILVTAYPCPKDKSWTQN